MELAPARARATTSHGNGEHGIMAAAHTMGVWITDGSLVEWSDTVRLEATFPMGRWPEVVAGALGEGLDARLEGIVDAAVAVGGAEVAARDGGLDVVAEWVALFDRPLAAMDDAGPATPCVLQGMIEGTWLGELARAGDVAWSAAAGGNNVVARGRGIATTLGALATGDEGLAQARATVYVPMAAGGGRAPSVTGADLARVPVVETVRAVQQWCRAHPEVDVRGVHFGAAGEMAAYAALPAAAGARRAHHAFLPRYLRRMLELCPRETREVADEVRAAMFREAIARGEAARPGVPIVLSVTDAAGHIVGEGAMIVKEEG
jgi:hypothetical protein